MTRRFFIFLLTSIGGVERCLRNFSQVEIVQVGCGDGHTTKICLRTFLVSCRVVPMPLKLWVQVEGCPTWHELLFE